jgi:hypothetical protein
LNVPTFKRSNVPTFIKGPAPTRNDPMDMVRNKVRATDLDKWGGLRYNCVKPKIGVERLFNKAHLW